MWNATYHQPTSQESQARLSLFLQLYLFPGKIQSIISVDILQTLSLYWQTQSRLFPRFHLGMIHTMQLEKRQHSSTAPFLHQNPSRQHSLQLPLSVTVLDLTTLGRQGLKTNSLSFHGSVDYRKIALDCATLWHAFRNYFSFEKKSCIF